MLFWSDEASLSEICGECGRVLGFEEVGGGEDVIKEEVGGVKLFVR